MIERPGKIKKQVADEVQVKFETGQQVGCKNVSLCAKNRCSYL
jgi:hypothetical protein